MPHPQGTTTKTRRHRRESRNLSSVLKVARAAGLGGQLELDLGIDYAPAIIREHGLKDAHLWPHVARRKGESFRVHARNGWAYPSLELRAANSWPAVTLDCDTPSAVVDALYLNHHGGGGPALPAPNMVVQRRSNSHSHISWFLRNPVHRGESARAAPLRKLARITEFYRDALDADTGYAGVLTHNPLEETHRAGEFQTHWGRSCSYSLDELAEPIPKGWRLPIAPSTETGRNCALFGSLLKWAGSPFNLELEVLPMARATNDGLDVPLGDSEVSAIAKSVERYRRSWIAKGRFFTEAEREAWGRSLGLQSAAVRRAANAQRDLRIREGHAAGWSQRHLAKLFKISQTGVWKVLRRHELEAQSQAVITVLGCWGWKEQKTGVGLKKLKIGAKRGSFDLYAAPGEAVHRSQQTDYTLCDNVVTYCH